MADPRETLRNISDAIKTAIADDRVGFALFIEFGGAWRYTSNAHRPDVVKSLTEWVYLTERGLVRHPGDTETSHRRDSRLAFERKCAEIGRRVVGQENPMGLFLFEFDGPNAAYMTNVPDFRERVVVWIDTQQNRN